MSDTTNKNGETADNTEEVNDTAARPAKDIRDAFSAAKNTSEEIAEEFETEDIEIDDDDMMETAGTDDAEAAYEDLDEKSDEDFAEESEYEDSAETEAETDAGYEEETSVAAAVGGTAVAATVATDPKRTTYEAALSAVANDEIAKKQRTLRYRLKRNKASYIMMGPYFILFFCSAGADVHRAELYLL